MNLAIFTFNPFQENTYIVFEDNKEAAIIDPGCSNPEENKVIVDFIYENGLKLTHLINTHCHIDHVMGNAFIAKEYNLPLTSSKGEQNVLDFQVQTAMMYGLPYTPSPSISIFIEEGDILSIGNNQLEVISCPGHSPDHICLYHKKSHQLIGGDVLFKDSIGRTDLPGGDHDTLIKNIKQKLLTLPEETVVYPGHGPHTTIGYEKTNNYFVGSRHQS